MPYVFPYETLFIWIMGLLIVGLLGLRVVLTQRRRHQGKGAGQPIQEPKEY